MQISRTISYSVANSKDDAFIDELGAQGIVYVLFFPLGGFTPLQSSKLDSAAASLHATPMQVALAWLLQRSRNILLIPGTSSLKHRRENLRASMLKVPSAVLAHLNLISVGVRGRHKKGSVAQRSGGSFVSTPDGAQGERTFNLQPAAFVIVSRVMSEQNFKIDQVPWEDESADYEALGAGLLEASSISEACDT